MTQPLFIKLYMGGDAYEFVNLMHVVSVKFMPHTCPERTSTVTLHLVNGQYHTVMGESAERLKCALENLDSTLVSETSEDYGTFKLEMTDAHTTTAQNLAIDTLSSN